LQLFCGPISEIRNSKNIQNQRKKNKLTPGRHSDFRFSDLKSSKNTRKNWRPRRLDGFNFPPVPGKGGPKKISHSERQKNYR